MTKHVLDRPRKYDGIRTKQYSQVERRSGAEGPHPAIKALHQRPQSRTEGVRAAAIYRAEREAEQELRP